MEHTLREIQARIGGELSGNGEERIAGLNTLEHATAGQLTFAEHARYAPQVLRSHASAVIVPTHFPAMPGKNLLRVENPRLAFFTSLSLFQPRTTRAGGVHPSAVVAADAVVAPDVTISEGAVVRSQAHIGPGTVIESCVHVGQGVRIGRDCFIGPNVVLLHGICLGDRVTVHGGTVIGGDGFGYVLHDGAHVKVPQVGNVVIEDDVEIGCNVCIDRATIGSTRIQRGTKIDNLVQIAHNNHIGKHVILAGQVGLSGSVHVGDYTVMGGKAGVIDHVTIGEGARIGAASVVIKPVASGESVWGYPARPSAIIKRQIAAVARLPKVLKILVGLPALLRRQPDAVRARKHNVRTHTTP